MSNFSETTIAGAMCPSEGRKRNTRKRLFQAVAAAFDVTVDELDGATRGCADVALARQTGMYLARVALGMTLHDAGRLFGRDRTTAAHACRIVEELRDDKRFDALLSVLESFLLRPAAQAATADIGR